jgi:putative MFS transporter
MMTTDPIPETTVPPPGAALPSTRLERLPRITRSHVRWTVVLASLFLCELGDIATLSYSAPAIRTDWRLSITEVGALTSATFLGMFFGALLGGRLADRYGRRTVLVTAATFFSLCSILSALAPGYAVFAALRFLTGAGVQATTGVLLVYAVEMFPRTSRGRYLSVMIALGGLGIPLIAGAARLLVPLGPDGWRWVFVVGGAGLVPAVLGALLLPESVRWLEANGRRDTADRIVDRLERDLTARGVVLPEPEIRGAEPRHGLAELRGSRYLRRTVVTSAVMVLAILSYYGFNSWVATLLVDRGFDTTQALTISAVLALAPVLGALAALPIIDRWERRRTSGVLCALVAVAMVVFAVTHDTVALVVAGFVAALLLQANTAVLYAYLPEVFPTTLRGIGSGIANGAGRIAGVANGFLVAAVAGMAGFTGVFLTTAVLVLLAGVVLWALGVDTRGRPLDDIARDGAVADPDPVRV